MFFYRYGINGIIGILLCSLIIGFVIYKTLKIVFENKIKNYKDFLNHVFSNEKLAKVINISINVFLCMTFFIMVSGFGTYFFQEFRSK